MSRWRDQSGKCPLCGTFRERLQKDRIVPAMHGGTYAPENVQYICANCHEDKTRKELRERKTTAETRAKLSRALKGKRVTENAKRLISERQKANWKGNETRREALSKSMRGNKARTGMTNSPESNAKRSASMKNRHDYVEIPEPGNLPEGKWGRPWEGKI
jgi:superfamily II helicase